MKLKYHATIRSSTITASTIGELAEKVEAEEKSKGAKLVACYAVLVEEELFET